MAISVRACTVKLDKRLSRAYGSVRIYGIGRDNNVLPTHVDLDSLARHGQGGRLVGSVRPRNGAATEKRMS